MQSGSSNEKEQPTLSPERTCLNAPDTDVPKQTQHWNLDMLNIPAALDHEEKLEFTKLTVLCLFL